MDFKTMGNLLMEKIRYKSLIEYLKNHGILLKVDTTLPLSVVEGELFQLLKELRNKVKIYNEAITNCQITHGGISIKNKTPINPIIYLNLIKIYKKHMAETTELINELTDVPYNFQAHQDINRLNEDLESQLRQVITTLIPQIDLIKDNKNGIVYIGTENLHIPINMSDLRNELRSLWGQLLQLTDIDIMDRIKKYKGEHHALFLNIQTV